MALGPDPNRVNETDPEVGKMGDPPSTRIFMPSAMIAIGVVVLAIAFVALLVW